MQDHGLRLFLSLIRARIHRTLELRSGDDECSATSVRHGDEAYVFGESNAGAPMVSGYTRRSCVLKPGNA